MVYRACKPLEISCVLDVGRALEKFVNDLPTARDLQIFLVF